MNGLLPFPVERLKSQTMKQKSVPISILIALVVALFNLGARTARAQDEVSPEFFYDALAPYGEWVDVGDYGSCWHPTGVDDNWAPYTDGYWAYTDAGWTWVSYEDFGGVVYHYGRWMKVEGEGWCWAPDYEWAPAWVSWRRNDDYIGWAPLPPEARWRGDIGFSVWVDSAYDIGPGYYNFCRFRDFGAPVLRGVIINRDGNFALIGRTRNITNITYTNIGGSRIVFNGGPDFAAMRGVVSHPIPALNLVRNSRFDPAQLRGPGAGKLIASRTVGNQLIVAAPRVAAPAYPNFFKGRAKKVIEAGKVTKGWGGIKDQAASQRLRQQIQAQTKGLKPETAHARPVAPTDLKIVPSHSTAVVPRVNPPAGNPVAGTGADVRKPFAPGEERKPDSHVRPPGDAGVKERPIEREKPVVQQPSRVEPREEPHSSRPTPPETRKGNQPSGKDKDKDKDKDKNRNGN
jgi:hypothetical protein